MRGPRQAARKGDEVARVQGPVSAPAEEMSWTDELDALLERAAAMAVEHGTAPYKFMAAAHEAYLRANPALREELERNQLLAQLEELRRKGTLAQA